MIAITFDTDHMSDASMETFISSFEIPGEATFFCTRRYALFDSAFRGRHEIALHPVFKPGDDWGKVTTRLRQEVGDPVYGVRPHSCAYDHHYGVYLAEHGFRYVSQSTWLYRAGLLPHLHPWGVWEIPIYFMDNMDYSHVAVAKGRPAFSPRVIERALSEDGLFVFDFHPILLLLNAANAAEYQEWTRAGRPDLFNESTSKIRGSAVFFRELVQAMNGAGQKSHGLNMIAMAAQAKESACG